MTPARTKRSSIRRLAGGIFVALFVASIGISHAEDDTYSRIQKLLGDGKYAEASSELKKIVEKEPDNGRAWYLLGFSYHHTGDMKAAIEADLKATEFPSYRADAFYNLACAYGVNGKLDKASNALTSAIGAGFIDFDLMGTDPDIKIIRDAGLVSFPPENKYDTIKARSGVEFGYKVVLPRDYDASKTYPALVSFAPGGWGAASCDWALENLWDSSTEQSGWIAVHLLAPERGWMTHPSHHALEELLDNIRNEHKIEGNQFHLVGFGNGARPATTYSGMSGKYFQSLTTVSNKAFAGWDDDDLTHFTQKRVFLLVGAQDTDTVEINRKASELMSKGGAEAKLTVIEGQGRIPAPLLHGGLMRLLDEQVRKSKS